MERTASAKFLLRHEEGAGTKRALVGHKQPMRNESRGFGGAVIAVSAN
jgi:hypothetical protein